MGIPQTYHAKPLVYSWEYRTEDGKPLGAVARYQNGDKKKDIVPFFNNGKPGITLNPRPLFGLECLANHPPDKAIFLVEGEKAAAALQSIGVTALTSLGGSKAADKTDWTPLSGFQNVIIWPDNDEPGEHYAKAVYQCLMALKKPPAVKLLQPEGLPEAGDCVDWLQDFAPNWDGYAPIEKSRTPAIRKQLAEALKKAKPIPDYWNLAGLAGSVVACFDEKAPGEIKSTVPPVQALNENLIPEPYCAWLADVSHRMQTPPDFATVSALVITGSVIGSGCAIRPKQMDDWEVIPNLWGACIGRPSVVLKSPSMKEPMRLLEGLQAKFGEIHEQEKAEAEFDNLTREAMLKDIKDKLNKTAKGKGKDGVVNPDEIATLKAQYRELTQDTPPEPVRRLFKTNETSIQSMTVLQNENPRGLLTFRDELTGLLVKWEREDGQDERAYFLEGWNGNGSYTDAKIGRGLTDAKNICISLLGGIQPDKLSRYLHQAMKGNNDGLMQRLQLVVWPDEPEHWQNVDIYPDKEARQRACDILKILADMDFTQYGATQGEYDDRPYYRFSDTGQKVFNDWLEILQNVKIRQEENPLMVEHFGKFRSLMPSLALIFHLIDIANGNQAGAVSEQAAQLAVKWCDYLESHARRIYAMADSPEYAAAVRLADKIKADKLPNPFTLRDVIRKGWHGLKDKAEIQDACEILIDENWLMMTRKPKPTTGRPPAPEYHINPFFSENA